MRVKDHPPATDPAAGPMLGEPDGLNDAERIRWAAAIDLGVRAAGGSAVAREQISTPPGGTMVDDRGVVRLVDQQTFGHIIGTHPTYLRRLELKGRLINPDGKIGKVLGWGIGRLVMWAIEYEYLNPDLSRREEWSGRTQMIASGALDLANRPHWQRDPVAYLTQNEAGDFLGIVGQSVYQAHRRDTSPREAVLIGERRGWLREGLSDYNSRRPPHLRALSKEP